MTSELVRDLTVLAVELGKVLLELSFVNSVELVGVYTCDNDGIFLVTTKGALEVVDMVSISSFLVDGERHIGDANSNLSHNLQLVPVPKDQGPVWFTSEGDDVLVLTLGVEGTGEELSAFIIDAWDILIR